MTIDNSDEYLHGHFMGQMQVARLLEKMLKGEHMVYPPSMAPTILDVLRTVSGRLRNTPIERAVETASPPEASERLLTPEDVASMVGVSISHLRKLYHRGEGPRGVSISPSRYRFHRQDVNEWIASRGKS